MLATIATTGPVLVNYRAQEPGTDGREGDRRPREVRFDNRIELRVRRWGLTTDEYAGEPHAL